MTVTSGTFLGPYEILALLGAGGMGEVYRARDMRLNRTVAVKILPTEFAQDAQSRARFEREAKTISQLNHPHICTLHDVGHEKGVDYLVMEYLEGETIADRLTKGPLPLDQTIRYGIQIADALHRAHRQGIVHRDLKPGNIMITKSGAKLLDFGLAKMVEQTMPPLISITNEPTQRRVTAVGTIFGTFQYMAPEQLKGLEADAGSDIFAFGCTFYEMLTGKRAFDGSTQAAVIASIMHSEPAPASAISASVPRSIDRLIRKCLEKEPEDRWQNAGDLATDLRWIAEEPAVAPGVPRPRRAAALVSAVAAMVVVGLVIGLAVGRWGHIDHPTNVARASFTVTLPVGTQAATGLSPTIAISPDGAHVAYVVAEAERTQIYLRAMDQVDGIPIPGTDGADGLFFSPDGRWVGFFADHKLKKIAIAGGPALTICDAGAPLGASWGPDEVIIFASVPDAGLSRVSASSGVPQGFLTPDFSKGESDYFWPEILPGGKAFVFTVLSSSGKSRIEMRSLLTGERRTLVDEGMNARYSAGHLVFSRADALFAVPFDVEHLQVTGTAAPLPEAVAPTVIGAAQFSLSRDGTLVYISGGSSDINRTVVWVNRAGSAQPLPAPPRAYQDPRLAADGRRLLVEIYAGTRGDLWAYQFDQGTLSRVTFEGFENETPVWMPDSERVAFSASRAGVQRALFWKGVGESGGDSQLVVGHHHMHLSSASTDGQFLAFTDYDPVTQGDIWVLPLTGTRQPRPFLRTPFHEWGAAFSPDSHWLAYVSNESGRDEVYVQAFPGPGQKRQISTEGGKEPVWARKGKELFYRNGRRMMSVSITTGPDLNVAKPVQLFEGSYDSGMPLGHTNYDVTSDGQRFVMIQSRQLESAARRVNIILNLVQELRPQGRLQAGH